MVLYISALFRSSQGDHEGQPGKVVGRMNYFFISHMWNSRLFGGRVGKPISGQTAEGRKMGHLRLALLWPRDTIPYIVMIVTLIPLTLTRLKRFNYEM